ncbi:MAG TPA: hypothetical protein VIO58_00670 [Candidatus Methanoperedens sp.]
MIKQWLPCLVVLIVAVSGCSENPDNISNETVKQTTVKPTSTPVFSVPEPSTVYVEIIGSRFDPPELRVINGTTVRWKNSDSAVYMITVDNFSSPNLSKRDTWNYTFTRAGIFEYNCSLHPSMPGGRIIVDIS